MSWLLDAFAAPLAETYFQKSMLGANIVAIVASVVGCLVVLRRMAFLGDALSHAMIAGVAGGYLVMKMLFGLEANAPGMLLGSLIAAIVTVGLIGFVSRVSRVKEDAAIGIMYTGIFALGVVCVSIFRHYIHIDLMHFIMGDVLGISDADLWVSALVAATVLTIIILFFRHLQIAAFDPVMAASIGLPIVLLDYVLTTCVSMVVVSAVSMVGVILVVGLLITPAATAYLLSDRLARMMVLAALFGVTSVVGGLYLCVWLDTAGGGAIMVFSTLQFLVVLALAPRYGLIARWLRQRRAVPQQQLEDILGIVIRFAGKPVDMESIRGLLEDTSKLKASLQGMVRDGLLENQDGLYMLTRKGAEEANRILRAHRLWETYLDHIGTPEGEIHERAHILEHISDQRSLHYLDCLLGNPKHDPHGKEIPLGTSPDCQEILPE
ncbi:MAG: iron chelate uptake ABC transporter family permease subunit [Desulfovibrionaceae bacterium]